MARNVVVEGIEGPIGQGTAEKAVRVVGASDDPALAQGSASGDLLRLLLVEQRITNLILAQALSTVRFDLDDLRLAHLKEI